MFDLLKKMRLLICLCRCVTECLCGWPCLLCSWRRKSDKIELDSFKKSRYPNEIERTTEA